MLSLTFANIILTFCGSFYLHMIVYYNIHTDDFPYLRYMNTKYIDVYVINRKLIFNLPQLIMIMMIRFLHNPFLPLTLSDGG